MESEKTPTSWLPQASGSRLNPERSLLTSLVRFNKPIARAQGSYLWDEDGVEYLDFSSQYGAVPFGYNPPFLWSALRALEAACEPSFVQPMIAPAAEALARRLSELVPGNDSYVIFCNSGAEAVEAALKLARVRTRRRVILSTHTGFHGKTLGAVSATGSPSYRESFLVDTTAFAHVPYDDLAALEARLASGDVAAFIVEPIQGESGMILPSPGYLAKARELCTNAGTLFVADEVQTGLGRTGRLFASEWDQVVPDMILLAKALGGGLVPLAACVVQTKVWQKEMGLYHSSTFANNHVTCRVGLAVLEHLSRDDQAVIRQVARVGDELRERLEDLQRRFPTVFREVRGRGLMLGLELHPWPADESYFLGMANYLGYIVPLASGYLLNEHRIVVLPTITRSNVLRIQPAFSIGCAEIDRLMSALEALARILQSRRFEELLGYVTGDRVQPSLRPPAPEGARTEPVRSGHHLGRFAFLIHPTDFEDLVRSLPPGCADYPAPQLTRVRAWLDSFRKFSGAPAAVHHLPRLGSKAGGYVEGWLISSMMTPRELMRLQPQDKRELMSAYLSVAHDLGADVVGLGAFTSVITRGGMELLPSEVPLTTGNSLTALMCTEALQRVCSRLKRSLASETVAILGAAGSVGRVAALDMASRCARLILLGNPRNGMAIRAVEAVGGEIYATLLSAAESEIPGRIRTELRIIREVFSDLAIRVGSIASEQAFRELFGIIEKLFRTRLQREPPIVVSVAPQEKLRQAGVVISATSHGSACVDPSWLAPRAIVCDVARPSDMAPHLQMTRPDVFAFDGGLVRLPERVCLGSRNILGFPPGVNLACLSETIVLTMAGVRTHVSLGNRIQLQEARRIHDLAGVHGFECHVPEALEAYAAERASLRASLEPNLS